MKQKPIDIALALCWQGCGYKGTHLGPTTLIEGGLTKALAHNRAVNVIGEALYPDALDSLADHPKMKYLSSILKGSAELSALLDKAYAEEDHLTLTVGGDHAVSLASLASSTRRYPNLGVIWVDAHGDMNTEKTSGSGNIHGMMLGASMGFGHPALTEFYGPAPKINKDRVFWVGARALDQGETDLIETEKLKVYTPEEIRQQGGLEQVAKLIMEEGSAMGIDAWHISFDLDFLDATVVKGTGLRIPNGFTMSEALDFFKPFLLSGLLKTMDLVEYNPELDDDQSTLKMVIDWANFVGENWQ